jgi:OmpA-OmpF porin, OOP family
VYGPFVRFQNVFDPGTDPNLNKNDAKIAILGWNFEFGASHKPSTITDSDRDGDGVPDAIDRCPDVPGPKANDGCPWPKVESPPVSQPVVHQTPSPQEPFHMEIQHKIQFDYDSAVLRSSSTASLKDVVATLSAHNNYRVKIEGHASSEGNVQHNQVLSLHRAQSVLEFLVSNGVARNRLTAIGFGSTKPIADNSTQAGREANRRVEFEVLTITISDDGESK